MNALLLAIALAACPQDYKEGWQEGHEWKKVLPASKSVHWEVVPAQHLNAICKVKSGWQAHGCFQWGPEICVIWAQAPEAETPQWIRCHERRHCQGWLHVPSGQ